MFADAGIPNATEHLLKAQVVVVIHDEIERRHLSQKDAAAMLGIKQPDVSKILRGNFGGFGLERLLRLVQKLGRDVEIKIPKASRDNEGPGRMVMHAQ